MREKYSTALALAIFLALVLAFYLIWNAIAPKIFGVTEINYLDSLSLLIFWPALIRRLWISMFQGLKWRFRTSGSKRLG
jgi:hypothetical protein